MKVSVIAGSHLGDFFNILPVISKIYKTWHEPIDFVMPRVFKEKFITLREFLEYQPMFNSVAFDDEKPYHGLQIHGYRRIIDPPEYVGYPDATWRAVVSIGIDHFIHIDPDNEFTLLSPEFEDEIDHSKPLIGERSNHSPEASFRDVFYIKRSGKFDSCNFLDYNDSISYNAWRIRRCTNIFISTFTGVSVMADLLRARHLVLADPSVYKQFPKFTAACQGMLDRHYYRDRGSRIIDIEDFEWGNIIYK